MEGTTLNQTSKPTHNDTEPNVCTQRNRGTSESDSTSGWQLATASRTSPLDARRGVTNTLRCSVLRQPVYQRRRAGRKSEVKAATRVASSSDSKLLHLFVQSNNEHLCLCEGVYDWQNDWFCALKNTPSTTEFNSVNKLAACLNRNSAAPMCQTPSERAGWSKLENLSIFDEVKAYKTKCVSFLGGHPVF